MDPTRFVGKWLGCKCSKCNAVKPLEDSSNNYVYVDDCMKKCMVCGAMCKNESTQASSLLRSDFELIHPGKQ